MNIRLFILGLLLLLSSAKLGAQAVDKMSDKLRVAVESSQEWQSVYTLLNDRVDINEIDQQLYAVKASREARSSTVINALKEKAQSTQSTLLLQLQQSNQVDQESIQGFWINNSIFFRAHPAFITAFSESEAIEIIDLNVKLVLDPYTVDPAPAQKKSVGGHEPGHDAIKAPQMWAMGYTGYGRKVMSLDTGVDPRHPALRDRYMGNYAPLRQSWYVLNESGQTPWDCNGHGTHTVGIMCGLDTATQDTIGVAFNARWIGSASLCGPSPSTDRNIAGFQWAMDPDSNSLTADDMPDVINCSWQDPSDTTDQCDGIYKVAFDAVEAAGIAIVFSCGNGGSGVSTITPPKNLNTNEVNVFCVANVNGNVPTTPISGSSSRGPSTCGGTGSLNIKPEVSAPGTAVRSCYSLNGYKSLNGTSMAAPHVSGAIALLKEAFPNLTGIEVKTALYNSCVDLGTPGEDNTYGMGIIDIPAAYNYLIGLGHTPTPPPVNDAAALSVKGLDAFQCDTVVSPVIVFTNKGTATLVSLEIEYYFDTQTPAVYNWSGSLALAVEETISLPAIALNFGAHEFFVNLMNPNGTTDERTFNDKLRRAFLIADKAVSPARYICVSDSIVLTATPSGNGSTIWYDSLENGNIIATGNNFTTPLLSSDTTYYVDAVGVGSVGMQDTADGNFTSNLSRYLIFDCFKPFTLNSVKVYANSTGNRTVTLKDSIGVILQSDTFDLPVGESTISLNFDIEPGTDYRLGISGYADLYYNNKDVRYPYELPGVVSIKACSRTPVYRYFYYYFDWQITYGSGCGRTAVPIKITQPINGAFTVSPAEYNLMTDDDAQFTDLTTGSSFWSWDFGDGYSSTVQHPKHSYSEFIRPYNVTLEVKGEGGACVDTVSAVYSIISSASAEPFPNPGNGIFRIDLGLAQNTEVTIDIYALDGKKIIDNWSRTLTSTFLQLDFTDKEAGIYIVYIKYAGKEITRRIVHTGK